jgi:hypothetical protein
MGGGSTIAATHQALFHHESSYQLEIHSSA